VTSEDKEPTTAHFRVDLDQLRNIARVGINRAYAFLGIAFNATEPSTPVTSLSLMRESSFHFFPEPTPQLIIDEAVKEFRVWATGNALREIDAQFSIFLDHVWVAVQIAKLHGQRVKAGYQVKAISADTNVASKVARILKELGQDETFQLRSLSKARNCLSHNGGIVDGRYTNADDKLTISWFGLDTLLHQGEKSFPLVGIIDTHALEGYDKEQGGHVSVHFVKREKTFSVGERIVLSALDLHEICFSYSKAADEIISALAAFLRDRNLLQHRPPAQENAPANCDGKV
jgi:hypothetical protein